MTGPLRMMRFYRDHRWTRRHLSEYLDDDLDAAGRARVEHHVHDCPDCWRLLDTLKRTVDGLMGLRDAAREGIADSVIGRLRAEP